MTEYFGEFFGTMIMIILGNGVIANVVLRRTKAEGSGWMVITAGWAFAVMIGIFCAIATGSSQADINPAVTLAKLLMGIYQPAQAMVIMLCQIAGGFVGACLIWLHFWSHWAETEDSLILVVFSTGPAIRQTAANLFSEIMGTIMLIVPVFAMFSRNVGSFPPGIGAYLAGILVWSIGLSLGGTTGYAINPARDLGPRLAHAILPIPGKGDSDWSYAWIPVVGPFIGALLSYGIARAVGII
jgi:glycerol uptake facilitator protein